MNKTVKWILIAVLIIAVIAFAIYLWQAYQRNQVPVNPNPNPNPQPPTNSLLDILAGLFSPGWVQNLFGGNKPKCDPNRPGYDIDGYPKQQCGYNFSGCDPDKCDTTKSGWNQCGFLDSRC